MAEPHRDHEPDAGTLTGSVFGKSAPSWSYSGYRFRNGWALLTLVLGIVSAFMISTPGLILVIPGIAMACATGVCAHFGQRRIADFPKAGGRRMMNIGLGAVPVGVLLALVWLGVGA